MRSAEPVENFQRGVEDMQEQLLIDSSVNSKDLDQMLVNNHDTLEQKQSSN